MADQQELPGALTLLKASLYGGGAGPDQLSEMMSPDKIVDPSMKWNAFAAAALKPATGGFGEAMGNALGAYAGGQQAEAELRAKYVPLIAQAYMQRQLQTMQLGMQQWKMSQEWDQAGTSALTSLLRKPETEPITGEDVYGVLDGLVQRQMIPPQFAQQLYKTLPVDDPTKLRDTLKKLSISKLDSKEAYGAVKPNVKLEDAGSGFVPGNTNTDAGIPVGAMSGPGANPINKGLSPTDWARSGFHGEDKAGNPFVGNEITGRIKYGNTGSPLLGVQGGAPGPGGLPQAALPPQGAPVAPQGPAPTGATAGGPPPGALPSIPGPAQGSPVDRPAGAGPVPGGVPTNRTLEGNALQTKLGDNAAKYADDLAAKVGAMQTFQQRLTEIKDLVKHWQPGATSELRATLAAHLKDMALAAGLSPEQSNALAASVSKGDISSQQAFVKLANVGAMEALRGAMDSGRITQGEFAVFARSNINPSLDPQALDKMSNFATRQYLMSSAELQNFTKHTETGGSMLQWPDKWNKLSRELGYVQPSLIKDQSKGSPGAGSETATSLDLNGRPIYWVPGKGWTYTAPK